MSNPQKQKTPHHSRSHNLGTTSHHLEVVTMATDKDPATTAEDKDLTLTVISELEDKTALEDIRDVKGHGNKIPAAVRHFNNFLVLCCKEEKCPCCHRKRFALPWPW